MGSGMNRRGPITAAALALLLALPVGAAAQGAQGTSSARATDQLDTDPKASRATISPPSSRERGATSARPPCSCARRSRAIRRNNDLLERAFVAFLADGAMPDAFRAADKLIQRDPSNGLAQLAIGIRALKQKNYQTARNHLQRGGRGRAGRHHRNAPLSLVAARFRADHARHRDAGTAARRASYNLFRDYHAGLILDAAGRKADAEKRLKTAYESEKTTLRLVDLWGKDAGPQRRFRGRGRDLCEFDRLLPNHPIVRDGLAKVAARQAPPRQVGNAQQGAAEVLYGLASAGNRQGDEQARRCSICASPSISTPTTTLRS